MPTKTRPSRTVSELSTYYLAIEPNGRQRLYRTYEDITYANETITYDGGGRLPSGHWPWKACSHVTDGVVSAVCGYASDYRAPTATKGGEEARVWYFMPSHRLPSLPSTSWDQSVLRQILDQIDLNTSDAVLLYSGILQAVPLLGSVSTFLRTFNKLAPDVIRRFRKRPFTEAVQSLISLDFIDRFVISPTLDDVRKFNDAVNYTLRVINTARERNSHRFALDATSTDVTRDKETTGVVYGKMNFGGFPAKFRTTVSSTSKAFALLEAKYDMAAVDPIKVWAQRVGLTRPLDSAWDLVPFSFVIDYFTRAGDFVSALSDEMSSVQGLKGTITSIHDLWGTFTRRSVYTVTPTGEPYHSGVDGGTNFVWVPGLGVHKKEEFSRFRVANPWSALFSLSQGSMDDYLKVNLDLSATRKRTIAELMIQAGGK